MPKYPTPLYSRKEVNRAGEVFVDPTSTDEQKELALSVINNWRASHNFPLNTFQMRLRSVSRKIADNSIVAQRIKRLASIRHKLERFTGMNMAQMQDIGGCRAIMNNIQEVDTLVSHYKHYSRGVKHKLKREDDYILNPKQSGYRGFHLVYKYKSDKRDDYNDMLVEIQIRTLAQHAWATTVEIIGTFIQQSLKSSQGEKDWLRFFSLMSSAIAIFEGKAIIPGTPDNLDAIKKEVIELSDKLKVKSRLTTFRESIEVLGTEPTIDAHYYLLELDSQAGTVRIRGYKQTQLEIASADYAALEKRSSANNAVLVSADSIEALRLAYPNYYLDADLFLTYLDKVTNTPPPINKPQLSIFD